MKSLILFGAIFLFNVSVSAQVDSTNYWKSFENFWADSTCMGDQISTIIYRSYSGESLFDLANEKPVFKEIEWILSIVVGNDGTIGNIETHFLNPEQEVVIDREALLDSLSVQTWPVCKIPYASQTGGWQIYVPMIHLYGPTFTRSSSRLARNLVSGAMQTKIRSLKTEHPYVLCPAITSTFSI
ncbi:hypothetical protein GGR27_003783 [Lewinella antarctica]|uniref:Uncharacterized protein n=1 Tax=Neolewinella antarctica TaxID=442734 RepID=A0ABX0XHQ8_9BACT|nr:hypothetical protein [Neolewinella antarctica]